MVNLLYMIVLSSFALICADEEFYVTIIKTPQTEINAQLESYRFIQFNATNYDLTSALTGVYDNIVKAYIEDVYRDSIELYVISTVKVNDKLIQNNLSFTF